MAKYFDNQVLKFFLVFTLIFISDESTLFVTNSNTSFVFFKYFFYIIITAVMLFYDLIMNKQQNVRIVYFSIFIVFISFASMIANQDFTLGNVFRLFFFLYALCFISRLSIEDFIYYFDQIMFPVALISIILFSCSFLFDDIFYFFPKIKNTLGLTYHTIGIYNVPAVFMGRNFGFCSEPGRYQALLLIGLLFQTSSFLKMKNYKVVVYIIALLTTLSTTGYTGLLLFIPLICIKKINYDFRKIFFLIIPFVCFVILYYYTDLFSLEGRVFEKFTRVNYHDGDSTVSRLASVFCNVKIALEHPVFGVGIQKIAEIFPIYSLEMFGASTKSNTNTILYLFASFGFLYGMMFNFFFLFFSRILFPRRMEALLAASILVIVCCGELFIYSGWLYVLMYYGAESFFVEKNCVYIRNK